MLFGVENWIPEASFFDWWFVERSTEMFLGHLPKPFRDPASIRCRVIGHWIGIGPMANADPKEFTSSTVVRSTSFVHTIQRSVLNMTGTW
jgi:hypothetical protein